MAQFYCASMSTSEAGAGPEGGEIGRISITISNHLPEPDPLTCIRLDMHQRSSWNRSE